MALYPGYASELLMVIISAVKTRTL